MEFVISPTLCQLRYSFQTWILQFHLSRGSDSNRDCFRIREVSSNLLDDLSIFSKITFNSAFMIFSRLTLQAISTTNVESSGKRGTRTPLLQGQYDNLWSDWIYSPAPLASQISKNLFSGSGGIRTHLLINHYTNLSRGRFYRPLVLHSQLYFKQLKICGPNEIRTRNGLSPTPLIKSQLRCQLRHGTLPICLFNMFSFYQNFCVTNIWIISQIQKYFLTF